MFEKINLTEDECTVVVKGIAFGAGGGILLGTFIGEVPFFFSLGGVCGIISTITYSFYKRIKNRNKIQQ